MIASVVFVTLLLASATVYAQPPTRFAFGESTTLTLTSPAGGWWFFDITAGDRDLKITQIGARTSYSMPGSNELSSGPNVFIRSGTSREAETTPNDGDWHQVSGQNGPYTFEVVSGATDAPPNGNSYVIVDIDDFLVESGETVGVAIQIPEFDNDELNILYDGDVSQRDDEDDTYFFPPSPADPGEALLVVSASTMTNTFDSTATVFGFHAPNVLLEFADADQLTIDNAVAVPALITGQTAGHVCAGSASSVNFTAQVTNNGFTFVPVDVLEVLSTTSPADGQQYLDVTRSIVGVTGCVWKIEEWDDAADSGSLADTEARIASAEADVDDDRVIISALGADAAGLDNNGRPGEIVFNDDGEYYEWDSTDQNHVAQLRSSFAFPNTGDTNSFQLGFLSADFDPSVPNIWVYVDGNLLTWTQTGSGIAIDPVGPGTDLDLFYRSTEVFDGDGEAHNIRVLLNFPATTADENYDLEFYFRDTTLPSMTNGQELDQYWLPLAASQASQPTFAAPTTVGNTTTWSIPSICVGGTMTLQSTVFVDASAPQGMVVTDTFDIDTTSPAGSTAVIDDNTIDRTFIVDRCSDLSITKTTLCDRSELSQWQVEFWQSDAQTVGNGTSPFYDFDTLIAGSAPNNTMSVDFINFGDASTGAFSGDETTFEELAGDSSMPAAQFFVRARGQILVNPAGFYTFYVASNRGVRLTIDGKNASILEEPFGIPNANDDAYENFYTASLTAGVHNVEIVMYDTVPNSVLELAIAAGAEPFENAVNGGGLEDEPSILDDTEELSYDLLATAPVCLLACNDEFFSGFTVDMWQWNPLVNVAFNNGTLIEAAAPFDQFDETIQFLTPDASDCGVEYINYQSDDGNTISGGNPQNIFGDDEFYPLELQNPNDATDTTTIDNFFFRASGRFFIGVSGVYTIAVNSNRGARVTIDGVVRIRNEPEAVGDYQRFVSLPFTAGEHTIVVDHYDSLRVSRLEVGIAAGAVTSINANSPFSDDYLTFALLGSALECQLEPQFDALETVVAGQNFTYTVTVNNNGPSDAVVTVGDTLSSPSVAPAAINAAWIVGVRTDDASSAVTQTGLIINWIVTVPAGESRRLFIDVAVPANTLTIDDTGNTTGICNTVTATPDGLSTIAINAQDTFRRCETIIRLVDLETSIVFSEQTLTANDFDDSLTATVTITNNGPSDTAGGSVPITIVTPNNNVSFVASGTASLSMGNTLLSFNNITVGQSVVLTIVFNASTTLTTGDITVSTGDFTLTNAAGERLIRTCDDEQSASATVIRQIDLELTKAAVTSNAADTSNAVAGQDTITYTITATNNGPSSLPAGARIVDTFYGDTTGLSVNSALTTFTPAGSYVTTLCGSVATTSWSIQYWNVNAGAAFFGPSPFADIDTIHANGVVPSFTEERDVLSIAEDDDDIIPGFAWTVWPTGGSPSVNYNVERSFYATATSQLDVRSAGHFTFAVNVNTGVRLSISNGVTSTKVVLQPFPGTYVAFHVMFLDVGVHDITVDYYHASPLNNQLLQIFIADGSRFTYPDSDQLGDITPEFYRLLTPADCEYACDMAPDRDAIDTEWRTRFWALNDSHVDNSTSVFERLDQILSASGEPLATAQTATVNFVRPTNTFWGEQAPLAGSFFSRSVGQIWIAEAGVYVFHSERPGGFELAGSRLTVDGVVLTAEVGQNPPDDDDEYFAIELEQGAHDVVFDTVVPCELDDDDCEEIDLEIARQTNPITLLAPALSYENLRTSTYCQVDYWVLPALAADETATLVLVVDVGSSAVAQEAFGDTVHYPRLDTPAENQLIVEGLAGDQASASVSISREVTLAIDVVATPHDVVAGAAGTADEVVFTVTVVNNGPSDTAGVTVRVQYSDMAAGIAFVGRDDTTDVVANSNNGTLTWTTKVIAAGASDVLELRFSFGPTASCDVDFPVQAEIIGLVDADGETSINALPIADTDAANVIRENALTLTLTNDGTTASASYVQDGDSCVQYMATVANGGPSNLGGASAQLALTLPLGAFVGAVSTTVQSSGPGSVLNVALPELAPDSSTTFTFDLCASSETPDAAVIDAQLSVVLLADGLCEVLTQTTADAPNVVVTREAARLDVVKQVASTGHPNNIVVAGEYAGNAPFIVTLTNDAVESDVDGTTVSLTINTAEVAADLHRVVLEPLDVGWTVEAFLPGQAAAGDLMTFPLGAPFVTFVADALDYSGAVPQELAAAATTANGFYLRASAPIVVPSDAPRTYTVTSTGDVELTIDGNVVANGAVLPLTAGLHQAVVRVAQPGAAAAFNLHVRAANSNLLGENMAMFVAGTPTSTWTIPVLRAGHAARLYEFFSALTANGSPIDTGKLRNTANVNEPTSPATLNGDGYDRTDGAAHDVHQYCVRGVDVVLELSREASVAYAGDNDFQHFVRVTNQGFVQCDDIFVRLTGTSTNMLANAVLLVSPQTVNLASGQSVLLPVNFAIDGNADATGELTTTARFVTASPPALAVNPLHEFVGEREAANPLMTISTPIDRLSLVDIAVVRTTNTQSDDVADNRGPDAAITYQVTFTNNGPSPARYPLVIFRCPTATPVAFVDDCVKIRVTRRTDADKLLTVGESRTVTVDVPASELGAGGSVFAAYFFAPQSVEDIDGTIIYSPTPIHVDTNVAPFQIGLEITAFEEIAKKRNIDAWVSSSSSSSSSSSESSSESSSSSDDAETRLIFVEVHNTNAIVNAENVAVLIQFGAHDKIEHAEALLTQSSRHDSVVNNGGPSFTWTIGELPHGARARIALKLRASSHLTLSAEIVAANACLATSATCEVTADLSVEHPFSKLF